MFLPARIGYPSESGLRDLSEIEQERRGWFFFTSSAIVIVWDLSSFPITNCSSRKRVLVADCCVLIRLTVLVEEAQASAKAELRC